MDFPFQNESREGPPDRRLVEPFANEHDPCAAIAARPGCEVGRRMDELLDAIHCDGSAFSGNGQDALHPQYRLSMAVEKSRQP